MPASDVSLSDMHSEASIDSEEEYLLAQQEWEESLQQLQQLVGALLLPYFGKWLGRQTSHWEWGPPWIRIQVHGHRCMSRSAEAHADALSSTPEPVPVKKEPVTFKDIGIRRSIYRALDVVFPAIKHPTETQQQFIPAILSGKDVLLKDSTGSGKSFGILLALLNKPRSDFPGLQSSISNPTSITSLLVVPHRDLAYQFMHWVEQLTATPGVTSPRYGGVVAKAIVRDKQVEMATRISSLRSDPPHILIGTPQALLDVYDEDPAALQLSNLSTVVVDEVDYLIETVPLKSGGKTFYKAFLKAKKKIDRHPSPTRRLLDIIYASRKNRAEQGPTSTHENLPQLVMSSATLRKHLDLFLFKEGRWLRRDQLVKIKCSDKQRIYDIGAISSISGDILHSVLIVAGNGEIKNMSDAASLPLISPGDEPVTPEAIFDDQSPPIESQSEKIVDSPSPFNPNTVEAIAAAFALDVPSIALLVLPASSPVHRAVYELKQLGVNAKALDLTVSDKGRLHLLTGGKTAEEAPTLLVATLASIRGLDLPSLTHVFILGIPEGPKVNGQTIDAYLHIAGRVGRFGKGGRVITVVEAQDPDGSHGVDDEAKMRRVFREIKVKPVRFEHFD